MINLKEIEKKSVKYEIYASLFYGSANYSLIFTLVTYLFNL